MNERTSSQICQRPQRRADVRGRLNGIEAVDVSADQLTLTVSFFGEAPDKLNTENVRIEGGVRITDVQVTEVRLCSADNPNITDCVLVMVNHPGDASVYSLSIHGIDGFDLWYSQIDFTFRTDCPSELDCRDTKKCPPMQAADPELNYLARDYEGFRQLLLDRLALSVPDWSERHIPDLGIALLEVLAYAGDQLSYFQDAVATESYLGTARRRISVRRHAKLMDYTLSEGSNARAWITVRADSDTPVLQARDLDFVASGTALVSGSISGEDFAKRNPAAYNVFRAVFDTPVTFRKFHNQISFYTWGARECCLPKGVTQATLRDEWEPTDSGPVDTQRLRALRHLQEGDVLIFEEIRGPKTGAEADADPAHRHAVLLTRVTPMIDPLYPLDGELKQPVVEIEWASEDALPFSICLSALAPPDCSLVEVSVARGNVLLVDHGRLVESENLGSVPVVENIGVCRHEMEPPERSFRGNTFRPSLANYPLTFRQEPGPSRSAKATLEQDARAAQPQILTLTTTASHPLRLEAWRFRRDLLASSDTDSDYTVEIDDDGIAHIRFGDGELGRAPEAGGTNAYEHTMIGLEDPHKSPVSSTGELKLVVGEEEFPIRLNTESNHLQGLKEAIEKSGAGVTVRIWKTGSSPATYLLYISADHIGRTILQLIDDPDGSPKNLLTANRQGEDPPVFHATYRVGNGTAGNVGAESITSVVLRNSSLNGIQLWPRNPLPAIGGTEPESIGDAKLRIPYAFRKDLQRAVTPDDYAHIAERNPSVQRAAAAYAWTGARYVIRVAIDPIGTERASPKLLRELTDSLYLYRRIGHEVQVVPATYVPVYIRLQICVKSDYARGHVKAALLDTFSARVLPNGQRGFFHPDNLTFGDNLYASRLLGAASSVPGVETAAIKNLQRLFKNDGGGQSTDCLLVGPLEVAQLDNNPSSPENGILQLDLEGGR